MTQYRGKATLQTVGGGSGGPSTFNVTSALSSAQISPITLSGLVGYAPTTSLTSGIQWDEISIQSKYHEAVKKYEVLESPEDVLALSVTWKRLNKINSSAVASISNLLSKELFEHITDEDRELGQEIRDYYSKKIMLWKLKNARFSKFRDELNSYIHSPTPLLVKNDLLGMIYYLPYFHEYDTGVDEVRVQVNPKINVSLQMVRAKSRELEPLQKIVSKRKSAVTNHYWLKDIETNSAVQFVFDVSNPLEHIWSMLFAKNKIMEVTGSYYAKSRDEFEYLSVKNWKLENI
jgi:hypothetical protein